MSEDNKIEKPKTATKPRAKAKPRVKAKPKAIEYDMAALFAKADLLGVDYHPAIGGKKLKEKIDLFITEQSNEDDEPVVENTHSVGPSKTIAQIEADARKTVAVIIIDNLVTDQSNPTIPLTVGNTYFKVGGLIKKEVPQDVPQILIDELKNKTMVRFVNAIDSITKRPTGNKIPQTIKRYNIQYL